MLAGYSLGAKQGIVTLVQGSDGGYRRDMSRNILGYALLVAGLLTSIVAAFALGSDDPEQGGTRLVLALIACGVSVVLFAAGLFALVVTSRAAKKLKPTGRLEAGRQRLVGFATFQLAWVMVMVAANLSGNGGAGLEWYTFVVPGFFLLDAVALVAVTRPSVAHGWTKPGLADGEQLLWGVRAEDKSSIAGCEGGLSLTTSRVVFVPVKAQLKTGAQQREWPVDDLVTARAEDVPTVYYPGSTGGTLRLDFASTPPVSFGMVDPELSRDQLLATLAELRDPNRIPEPTSLAGQPPSNIDSAG
ncbi:MAG: hypothetical protein JWQ43_3078 [Glaciihabitans sp.]|nr:hypothetical protein [Glaciihabitans sp.]